MVWGSKFGHHPWLHPGGQCKCSSWRSAEEQVLVEKMVELVVNLSKHLGYSMGFLAFHEIFYGRYECLIILILYNYIYNTTEEMGDIISSWAI